MWGGPHRGDIKGSRHTGLFFSIDARIDGTLVHAVNDHQEESDFHIDTVPVYNPLNSATLAGSVVVAVVQKHVDVLAAIVQQVPPKNDDPEWNCQHWVGDALKRLQSHGVLTEQQISDGLDGMADLLLQGADDQF